LIQSVPPSSFLRIPCPMAFSTKGCKTKSGIFTSHALSSR